MTTPEELYNEILGAPGGKRLIDEILRNRPDYLKLSAAHQNAIDAYNAAIDSGDSALIEKRKTEWLAEWEKFSGQKFWDNAQELEAPSNPQ